MGSNYLELGMPGRLTEELQVTFYLSLTADLQKYINYKACIKFVIWNGRTRQEPVTDIRLRRLVTVVIKYPWPKHTLDQPRSQEFIRTVVKDQAKHGHGMSVIGYRAATDIEQ